MHYIFAASVYREKKDMQRNIDLGYKQGKKNTSKDGKTQYTLKDPYSVFQNVANTPAYHKKGKMEMIARLDNFGPFHIFFTLSCANYWWPENLTSILNEHGIGLRCSIDNHQQESYEVFSERNGWVTMNNYIKNEMDETLHEVFRRNVVIATRIYQVRVQAMMQTIVRNPSNPLSVKHFSSKLEFASRGAGHHHGVLWLDISKIEQKVDISQLHPLISHQMVPPVSSVALGDHLNGKTRLEKQENTDGNILAYKLKDPSDVWDRLDDFFNDESVNIEKRPKKPNGRHGTLKYLEYLLIKERETQLNDKEGENLCDLKLLYPLYGLQSTLKKLHKNEEPTKEELQIVVKFVDAFSTVSLHPAIVGSIVADIAQKVNKHRHTKTCRKYKTVCRFNMPKLPSKVTMIARPPGQNITDNKKSCRS